MIDKNGVPRHDVRELLSTEFIPCRNYVLVKPTEKDDNYIESESGFRLATIKKDSVLERPPSGTVVAVGNKVEGITPGDYIVWVMTDGQDMAFKDGDFLLLRQESVIGYTKKKQNPS